MNKKQSIGLCSLLLTSAIAHAEVSGTVFQDIPLNGTSINEYGTKDSNEQGVAGITVTAYPSGAITTTKSDGTWSLESTGKVRVEFTNLPAGLEEGEAESSVQFIDGDSSSVNLALYNPSEYTTSNKNSIAMTTQASATLNTESAVGLKILNSTDIPNGENDSSPEDTSKDVAFKELGSVWGLAYDTTHKNIYAAAALRRHGAIGPEGLGAIYKIDEHANVELFTKVADVGEITSNDDRKLSTNPTNPSHDPIFDEVGRVGLGDIDMSEDGKKLYVINITTNNLVEINIKTKEQKAIGIGNPFAGECSAENVKSWGIGQKNGEVYVGSVCTNNTTQGAIISKLKDGTFSKFHQIPLDMDGENSLYSNQTGNTNDGKRWRTWITNITDLFDKQGTRSSLPAPILSDIVFDENRGMILGFADRTAMQAGVSNFSPDKNDEKTYKYDSAGDIYRVCKVAGKYINEGADGCAQHDEIDGNSKNEFFIDDEWIKTGAGKHKEIALGGLGYIQGSSTVATSAFDPAQTDKNNYNTSGIIWMNRDSGKKLAGQVMVGKVSDSVYNGKAGGIGDLEILTEAAPTEIGDKVWFDENKNCVQDANETGISGVTVNLYADSACTGSAVKTTTTDENGRYSFKVDTDTVYSVCIDGVADQEALKDKNLTTCEGSESILNNSDATLVEADAKIAVAPLTTGANNHSFDFGFSKISTEPEPDPQPDPQPQPQPEPEPTPSDSNRTIDHTDGSCDCHSYSEDSTPSLSIWSMMILISLTSFMAFLFRKELNQSIK